MNTPATIPSAELARVESLEAFMLSLPQVEVPLTHFFAPGVYVRQVVMPKDSFVIGHCHKTEHFNVVMTGRATVLIDGVKHEIQAPCIFKSGVNVRKVLFIREEMTWATIHPTNETNLEQLEAELIVKSDSFLNHAAQDVAALQDDIVAERTKGDICLG